MKDNKFATNVINIKDIDLPCPDLKNVDKTSTIVDWMIKWIEGALKSEKIKHNDLLPSKADFAYMLGVSMGTVQNAIRSVEDKGYLVSKQKVGTFIYAQDESNSAMKLTSKRDAVKSLIKKYVIQNNILVGDVLPSARKMSELIEQPLNTVRAAYQALVVDKIFEKKDSQAFLLLSRDFSVDESEVETLVQKIKKEIENYILSNCKISDKVPTNIEFSKMYNVGLKTVNDSVSMLVSEGVLVTLRGKYGTIVAKMPSNGKFEPLRETSIFAPAAQTAYYYYEKTQQVIKRMIAESYYPGSKLPPILTLAKQLELSPNTVRRAIKELTAEGILTSSPGRFGGTFVIARPQQEEPSYQWLAVSSDYVAVEEN